MGSGRSTSSRGSGVIAQKQVKLTIIQLFVFRRANKSSQESVGLPSISTASSSDNTAQHVSSFNFSIRKNGVATPVQIAENGVFFFEEYSIKGIVSIFFDKQIN